MAGEVARPNKPKVDGADRLAKRLGMDARTNPAAAPARIPEPGRNLPPATVLALQRLAGNAAVSEMLETSAATSGSEKRAAESVVHTEPVVQRYQAGAPGHGGIEAEGLKQAGFSGTMTEGEIGAIYFGNWLRDFSQFPNIKHIPDLINVLSMGEFNRPASAQEIGGYLPSEHTDRPTIDVTKADIGDPALEHMDKAAEARLSDDQKLWVREEHQPGFKAEMQDRARASHLPAYIEVAKEHSKRELRYAARGKRGDRKVMAAIGNGLHAVEDYFSHSNFVDAGVYMLVRDHQLPADSPIYKGIVERAKRLDYDPSGDPAKHHGRAEIFSGSARHTGNDAVSMLEVLESEIKSGALHKAAILGALRLRWVKLEDYAEAGLGAVGKVAGGAVGASVGAVGGGVVGAGKGAARGWHEGHGWKKFWTGTKGLVGGLIHGGGSGGAAGWHKGGAIGQKGLGAVGRAGGWVITKAIEAAALAVVLLLVDGAIAAAKAAQKTVQAGAAVVGGAVGGVRGAAKGAAGGWSKGHGLGKITSAAKGAATQGAKGTASGARAGWHGASDDAIKEHYVNKATKADRAGGDMLPNHSQLAKDDTDHPLYRVSRCLAIVADREIGEAMIRAWSRPGDKAAVEAVVKLVDKFVCHPADNDWWKDPLMMAATGHGLKGQLTLPAAAGQPASPRQAPRRQPVPAGH